MLRKTFYLLPVFFLLHLSAFSFEKLPEKYLALHGSEEAPIKVVEYFSLSCLKCLKFIKEDFSPLLRKYQPMEVLRWEFHPDPADLLTLQFMACLEGLSIPARMDFLMEVAERLYPSSLEEGGFILKEIMEKLGRPVPDLENLAFIERSAAFQAAYQYCKQKDIPTQVPTVEINGVVYQEFPSLRFLEGKIEAILGRNPNLRRTDD